jgi:hypothetical protein
MPISINIFLFKEKSICIKSMLYSSLLTEQEREQERRTLLLPSLEIDPEAIIP